MLALREYRNRADRLADHLPWAALVAPGVVLNKDGGFQRTLRFRGPDLESATQAELVSACARANNVLKRFGARRWAIPPASFLTLLPGWSRKSGAPRSRRPAPISRAATI